MSGTRSAADDVARWLARRPLSRAEARERLERAGHAPAEVEGAIARAERYGWIDDAKLAYDYVVARAARLGRGRARLVAELEARGVARSVAEAAWCRAIELGEVEPGEGLRKALRRRLAAGGPLDARRFARVYNALLREGFERDQVESALAPHRALLDRSDEGHAERTRE